MRLPSFRYVVLLAIALGGVPPFLIIVGFWMHMFSFAGERLFLFWPSSVLLMAMEPDHTAQALSVAGVSIATNILLYLVVLAVLWRFARMFHRWRA
jgi:hypothetical protein